MRPYIIVVSSSKGGVGKSTIGMQIAVFFLKKGKKVLILDCDIQGTTRSYLENRKKYNLSMPDYKFVTCNLSDAVNAGKDYNIIIIDTPGSKSALGDEAHLLANTILTVMNDSFVDLDVLVKISDPEKYSNSLPGHYAEDIWEARKKFLYASKTPPQWLIVLNRVGYQTKNHIQVTKLVKDIAQKWGVQFGGLIRERVGYREGFLYGRTPLDPQPNGLNASHLAARLEIRQLAALINTRNS